MSAEVKHTTLADLDFVFEMFEQSILYQEKKGYVVWRDYDRQAIVHDIELKQHYKIEIDNKIAIAFSVAYADKIIWRQYDTGNAIYLHRIVVNPEFKGQKLFGNILDWAIGHAHKKNLTSVRMDTWANNPTIQKYYRQFGFQVVENFITPDSTELPQHNRKLAITLLEYPLNKNTK